MTAIQSAAFCGGRRLSVAPLETLVGGGCGVEVAARLGVHHRQLYRWRHQGLTWAQADILAVRAGVHPSQVWGDGWWTT